MNHASRICFILSFCLLTSCESASEDSQRNKKNDSQENANGIESDCVSTIEKYVTRTRAWDRSSYDVVREQLSPDLRGFSVREKSDSFVTKGGRKSFHADMDTTCTKVVRELKYQ